MPFSDASGEITITGNETDDALFADPLNAASDDSGIYIDRIPGVAGNGRYLYVYKEVRLIVEGTYNIQNTSKFILNPFNDWGPIRVNGGTLNIGGEQTLYGLDYGSQYPLSIELKRDTLGNTGAYSAAWRWGAVLVNIQNDGVVNIYGADCHFKEGNLFGSRSDDGGNVGAFEDGTLLIKNSRIIYHSDNSSSVGRMSFGGGFSFTADDVELVGSNGIGLFELSGSELTLDIRGMGFRHLDKPLQINNGVTGRTFERLDFRGNEEGIIHNQNAPKSNTFRNNAEGNDMSVSWNGAGTALLSCSVELIATSEGSPANPKFKLIDTDSGNRQAAYSSDFEVSGALNGGSFGIVDLFTGVYDKPVATSPDPTLDDRLPYTGIARLYGSLDFAINIASSAAEQSAPITMASDPVIVLPELAAGALTGMAIDHVAQSATFSESHTLSEVYDFASWDLTQDANIITTLRLPWFISSDRVSFTSNYDVTLSGAATLSGGQLILGAGKKLTLGTSLGYSGLSILATGVVNVDASPAALDLSDSSNSFADGAVFEVTDGGSTTITVATQALVTQLNAAKTETSGSITFQTAPVTFTGFPTGNNANGVAYNALLAIRNTSDSTLFTADASSGSVTKRLAEIGDGAGPFEVWGDGRGLRRTVTITIPAAQSDNISLAGLFEEFQAEDGTILIGLAAADTGATYDQPNSLFEFTGTPHFFLGVIHQFDAITSTQAGQAFDNNEVRNGIQFIKNQFAQTIILSNAFQVAAVSGATERPVFVDFVVRRADNSSPYNDTLTGRPLIQEQRQAEAAMVAVSSIAAGAITADAVAASAVLKIQDGLSTFDGDLSGAGPTQQEVRDAFKLAPSAGAAVAGSIDTLLADIPTVSEFEDRTLVATDYFVVSDYTVPPTTAEIEGALLNEGDGQQLIDAIIQVINSSLDVPVLELTAIANAVWTFSASDRTLTGGQATNIAAIPNIPTNPLTDFSALPNVTVGGYVSGQSPADLSPPIDQAGIRAAMGLDSGNLDAQIANIPVAVEAAIINEGDGQQVIDAFLQVVNANLDLPALELQAIASAVWAFSSGDRSLSGLQATNLATIPSIPTNPLLAINYVAPDNDAIADIQAQINADEEITPTLYRKRNKDTNAVIREKNVTNDGSGNITLTEST
ncbi:MAG: hypothetical protein AAF609_05390 [Cyanobacteria bacterium P01_C01_bin.120]